MNIENRDFRDMKTKEKVEWWLNFDSTLKDNDNRLCSNIWAAEIGDVEGIHKESKIYDFLIAYAKNQLTSAPSIKRARAKLQEENPSMRGEKYMLRKGKLQDKWRQDLGYEKNQ
jgi:hypothetical protein|tara:strand:- start:3179 stop:3520 length:342 start_codon:yes stop_codon:yes gene_type:complete